MIADELDFADGFDNAIVDTLLDRIELYKTDDKKVIDLKVFFKVLNEKICYTIARRKCENRITSGLVDTSVCSEAYI
jgi:hypothetical protein